MRIFIYIVFITIIISCRPHEAFQGQVQDLNTNKPIVDARVYDSEDAKNETYTDSLGNFKINATTVIVEKDNYISKTLTFDHCESEYVLLKPNNYDK